MKNAISLLKETLGAARGEAAALALEQASRVERDITRLTFLLERAQREKQTLATLLSQTSDDLETSYALIKQVFGRYLSTEVMNSLLADPTALELGGDRRRVTIMMTDLRGFTAISEQLRPEQVMQMLNTYFDVMVPVIMDYRGTINEIIGDALLVIFGAPQPLENRVSRAIACAIDMQNAMETVNRKNRDQGLPAVEMGIGINEIEAVVGNVGSEMRSKYAVVGSGVNMTSRIESYSVGGQVLISDSAREQVRDAVRIGATRDIFPKGAKEPFKIYEVTAITGEFNRTLTDNNPPVQPLDKPVPVTCSRVDGKHVGREILTGSILGLSSAGADIRFDIPLPPLTNIRLRLCGSEEGLTRGDVYAKVMDDARESGQPVRFTAIPPEIDAWILDQLTRG